MQNGQIDCLKEEEKRIGSFIFILIRNELISIQKRNDTKMNYERYYCFVNRGTCVMRAITDCWHLNVCRNLLSLNIQSIQFNSIGSSFIRISRNFVRFFEFCFDARPFLWAELNSERLPI